jgi:hypothetical protein
MYEYYLNGTGFCSTEFESRLKGLFRFQCLNPRPCTPAAAAAAAADVLKDREHKYLQR